VIDDEAREEDLVIGGESSRTVKAERISPHAINAFWFQPQISEVYPNSVTTADKAASVLSILSSESGARDCENQLMELFDYQSFISPLNLSKIATLLYGVPVY
jgi:pre-mRNA-splicing helicase BRR2